MVGRTYFVMYAQIHFTIGLNALRDQLSWAEEDLNSVSVNSSSVPTLSSMTPGQFLKRGLDLEVNLYVLSVFYCTHLLIFLIRHVAKRRADSRKKSERAATDHQVHEQRRKDQALKHEYQDWVVVRQTYVPIANALDEAEAAKRPQSKSLQPWEVKLWLPSSIPIESRDLGCVVGLPALEKRARVAQAILALAHIRMGLRMRYNAQRGTQTHAYGTGEKTMTRARARLRTIDTKLGGDVHQYRIAYDSLLSLDPNKAGFDLLRPLSDADVRGPDWDADEVDLD
jgi:hypothetical protein